MSQTKFTLKTLNKNGAQYLQSIKTSKRIIKNTIDYKQQRSIKLTSFRSLAKEFATESEAMAVAQTLRGEWTIVKEEETNLAVYDVTDTFKKWEEVRKPYFEMERAGTEVKAKRFKIYEDDKIKVCRVEESTFVSEHENTIQVQVKNPFMLFDMQIGGCISRQDAIANAQLILSKIVK